MQFNYRHTGSKCVELTGVPSRKRLMNMNPGPAGFMSTLDSNSPGNYGLLDVLKVLEFTRDNIHLFRGDPTQVTVIGHDAGAAIVGLLLVSPLAMPNSKCDHHQAEQ